MAKKSTTKRSSLAASKTLTLLKKRRGGKLRSELTEEERREFDAATAKWVADLTHQHDVELPNWLESLGLPRDPLLAASIAVAELGEFVLPSDLDDVPMDNFYDLIKMADGKKRWGLRVAAQMKRKPTGSVTDQPRADEPSEADLLIGRQVLDEMPALIKKVERFRDAVRAKGLKGSNAKLGKVLSRLKAEKKMSK